MLLLELLEKSINHIISAIENGKVRSSFSARLQDLELELDRINAEINLEKSKNQVKHTVPFASKYYLDALKFNSIKFASALVKKIMIDKVSMDIYLANPYDDEFKDCELIFTGKYKKTYSMKQTKIVYEKIVSIYI